MVEVGGRFSKIVRTVVEAVRVQVTVKMRLGWDETTITAPRFARELAESLPDSEIVMIPGAGHFPTLTRPADVANAVIARFGADS